MLIENLGLYLQCINVPLLVPSGLNTGSELSHKILKHIYTVTSINLSTSLLENPEMANGVVPCFLFSFLYLRSVACRRQGMARGQTICRRTKQIITLKIHLRHHTYSSAISVFHEQSSTVLANETEWLILQDTKKISEHVWQKYSLA